MTSPTETHLTAEPSEGRLGVMLLQAVMACEVSIGSRSHTGVALPSCLEILSSSRNIPCLHVCILEWSAQQHLVSVLSKTTSLGSSPHDVWYVVSAPKGHFWF